MKVNIRIYSVQEVYDDGSLEKEYKIKIEVGWLQRNSSDGTYYTYIKEDLNILKKAVKSLKIKYPNHKIIDKKNILKIGSKNERRI